MRFSCIFPKHLAQNCTSPARFRCENTAGKGVKRQEMWDNPTPYTLSYTQTYTRNCQVLLGFPIPGVGNVGDFQKTFFMGGRKNVETSSTRRRTGIPKHRTSLHKTSVLLRQNLRTFAQRSPMFLISETLSCGGLPKRIAKKEIPRPPGNPVNGGFCPIIL